MIKIKGPNGMPSAHLYFIQSSLCWYLSSYEGIVVLSSNTSLFCHWCDKNMPSSVSEKPRLDYWAHSATLFLLVRLLLCS